MDKETQIAETLKQNIPQPAESTPAVSTPLVSDPSLTPITYDLDEMTLYKLQQHFGDQYKEGDFDANKQASYIYQTVSERVGSQEYPVVVAKINDLKQMLGINHAENARYKLYEWLRLDQKRSKIEMEMNSVRGIL